MQYVIGFIIALFIALTGVGAGTVTVPVLVLFLGVPAPVAVGIGLMFATAVKLILVPTQIARRNVAWRTLAYMLAGGVPGVLAGSLFLKHLAVYGPESALNAILGAILVTTSAWQFGRRGRARLGGAIEPDAAGSGPGGGHGHSFWLHHFSYRQRRALVFPRVEHGTTIATDCWRGVGRYCRNITEHPCPAASAALCAMPVAAFSGRAISV
jgi:Sulfite exporter TauE/SafE